MIEINDLVKKYGDHVAVNHLSLKMEPGRIYGFLGPNGAGKSTTMNILTGYLAATSGQVKINGYDIFKKPEEAKRCIGYLPELPPLYTEMTVKEYMTFVAELKKLPKAERQDSIGQVMRMTGIKEVENRLIRNLSKGYRQRVGLAQAILGFPDIIILDEPTVGLDPKQIAEIRDLIKELGKNHTVILSSHILSEIRAVCDYVFIISHGRLVANDTTENLLQNMSKTQEINLLIKGEKASIVSALEQVEGLESIAFADKENEQKAEEADSNVVNDEESNASDNTEKAQLLSETRLTVTAKKGQDIRENLFYAMADHRLPILEMHMEEKSLEEVFIELTSEGGNE